MCGRFTLTASPDRLAETFSNITSTPEISPRYNIAPTQTVAVVANNDQTRLDFFQWGLIPFWAKDPAIGQRMINARAETLAEKSAFKNAYKRRRCLILADGFYEWRQTGARGQRPAKTPYYIRLKSGQPFAFAGLWESWQSPQADTVLSCTIITTTPNDLLAELHNRMPVILPAEAYEQWLDPDEQPPQRLDGLLRPYPADLMVAYPVSTLVNNPKNDSPECILPAAADSPPVYEAR